MKIIICGDICPTDDYRKLFDTPEILFGDVVDLIKNSDYSICNLECPATDCQTKALKTGPNLKAEKRDVAMLSKMGFNAFSIGNNHILDYGPQGVVDTLNAAKENKIDIFGGGINATQAKKPLIADVCGKKIGFMAFAEHEFNIATDSTPGANLFDPYTSIEQVRIARKECDFLVVLYHGGIEHYIYPSPLLQKKCHAIADAGANIVLCQHSHCIGTKEEYNNATIVYGQGNCVFGYREGNDSWNMGLILELEIDDNINIKYHLIKATKDGISLCDDNDRINKFLEDSQKINNTEFLANEFSAFCKKRSSLDLPLFFAKNRIMIKLNRIFGGKIFKLSKNNAMITHNLIRCDAWNEVIQEDLRSAFNDE